MIKRFYTKSVGNLLFGVNNVSGEVFEISNDSVLSDYREKQTPQKNAGSLLFLTIEAPIFLQKNHGLIAQLLSPLIGVYGFFFAATIVMYSYSFGSVQTQSIKALTQLQGLSLEAIAVMVSLLVITKALHEVGHASALRRYGQKENGFGLKLITFIAPLPFCQADEAYLIADKKQRFMVAASGLIFEGVALVLLGLIATLTSNNVLIQAVGFLQLIYQATLIFNILPFVRFDGSWALALYSGQYAIFDHALIIYKKGFKKAYKSKKIMMFFYGFLCSWNSVIILGTIIAGAYYINVVFGIIVNIMLFKNIQKKLGALAFIAILYFVFTILGQDKAMVVTLPDNIEIHTSVFDTYLAHNSYQPENVDMNFNILKSKQKFEESKIQSSKDNFRFHYQQSEGYKLEIKLMQNEMQPTPVGNFHNPAFEGVIIKKGDPISVTQSDINSFWVVVLDDYVSDEGRIRFIDQQGKVISGRIDFTKTQKLPEIVAAKAKTIYANFQQEKAFIARILIDDYKNNPDPYQLLDGYFL